MFIKKIYIKNFRGIKELWYSPNEDVNILVGPNNAGKTTILRALNYVLYPYINLYREGTFSKFDFYRGDLSNSIIIRCWLEITENDQDQLKTLFNNKLSFWKVKDNKLEPILLGSPEEEMPQDALELLAIELIIEWDDTENAAKPSIGIIDENEQSKFGFSTKEKEEIGFCLFQTARNPLYQLSLNPKSLLSRSGEKIEVSKELRKLLGSLEENKNELVDSDTINQMFSTLKNLVSPSLIGDFSEYSLTFLDADISKLRSAISISLKDKNGDFDLPMGFIGDGIQNLLLLLYISDSLKSKNAGNFIVSIEEPEQNLEPSIAKWMFRRICRSFEDVPGTGQIFVTTHAPFLIPEVKGVESICRVNKNSTSAIVGRDLPQDIRKTFEKYRDKFATSILSKITLIVEGDSEVGLLPTVFNMLADNLEAECFFPLGLSFLSANGKNGIVSNAKILKAFNIPVISLIDYDVSDENGNSEDIINEIKQNSDFVISWPKKSPLPFYNGFNLETLLVSEMANEKLFNAIKICYGDAGHILRHEDWELALTNINDETVISKLPDKFPEDLDNFKIEELEDEVIRKAFLFSSLYGPHCCKSVKDMRLIAENLSLEKIIMPTTRKLVKRINEIMKGDLGSKQEEIIYLDE